MDKKKIAIIIGSLIITAGFIWVVILIVQAVQPPQTGSDTANPLPGVSQSSDGEGTEQSPSPSSSVSAPPAKRSDTELLDSIVKQKPSLADSSGKATFAIVNAQRTPNAWYVVTITNTQDPSVGKAKIILKDNGDAGGIVLIAGPGTKFDPNTIALPDEVRKLL